ncbi:HAD-IIIC family phosphatase [Planctomicrobium sp. SH664]|uniref:HAD-IIIC family phosphatase n=1 Tax=Planctomicrobium sp. SH664 TaxID=3448125 RepID=UPI003F5CBC2B
MKAKPVTPQSQPYRITLFQTLQALAYLLTYATLASVTLAALIVPTGLVASLPVWGVIALLPVFYFAWLVFFLGWGFLIGLPYYRWVHRSPARYQTTEGPRQTARFQTQMSLYLKAQLLQSLPLASVLQTLPFWQQLMFRGYAPRNPIGRHAHVWGVLWDPDLTTIGDDSVVGAHTHISCHAVTVQPDGSQLFVREPVVIGERVTVAADCRIALGVRIGDDAMLEPGSNVTPFTMIPPGQVWAGNPAKFVRMRSGESAPALSDRTATAAHASNRVRLDGVELEIAVRELVAGVLNVGLDQVPSQATTQDLSAWDSLSQLGIAAAIHSRFNIEVGAAETFTLRSIQGIVSMLRSRLQRPFNEAPAATQLPANPELLPLFDHELVTRSLAQNQFPLPPLQGDELRVVIASTFTAEPLASSLKLWSRAFGLNVLVEFAGFNQITQELLSSGSLFHSNRTGLNVILTRPEDLLAEDRASSAETLLETIRKFASTANGTLVVGTLPPATSSLVALDPMEVTRLREQWSRAIGELPGVTLWDAAAIVESIGLEHARQTEQELIARAPYSAVVYRELGISLARLVRQRRIASAKVIALDADGVLWGGVIAEDGLQGIQLGSDHPGRSFRMFQQYIKSLKARGQLLVLVSRNEPEDVWKVFDEHPEMVLRREDFSGFRINWEPKSQNVKALAKELNLGLDAFVFIDDDVANRLEMEARAPEVTVFPLPVEPSQYVPVLSRLWRFDSAQLTAEDRARTLMIQQEQQRKELQGEAADLTTYLHSLQMRVTMRRATELDLPRVAQLTQKTNQFNLSLKRRTLSELSALGPRFNIFSVEAEDRFGNYGLVGAAILERTIAGSFLLDTLLMSCRVLGRGVEEATLHGISAVVRSAGGGELVAPFVAGPRNQPLAEFLQRTGFQSNEGQTFLLPLSDPLPLPGHIQWQAPLDSMSLTGDDSPSAAA